MSKKEMSEIAINEGDFLWEGSPSFKARANITDYMNWLNENKQKHFTTYAELWEWSVEDLEGFWESIWDYFPIQSTTPYTKVIEDRGMPDTKWFTNAQVNYAEHILNNDLTDEIAIYAESETVGSTVVTWADLKQKVKVFATKLRKLGVEPGDRVAAYLPNIPEAVIAILATTSIGAIWSSCSPDFGVKSVLDRFQQIEPKVLIGIDGYTYGGKQFSCTKQLQQLASNLPTMKHFIYVPYVSDNQPSPIEGAIYWEEMIHPTDIDVEAFTFANTPFEHPLWILYSSGTTGIPKGIVHSHGGILVEMYKALSFHLNLSKASRLFFFTTTGWMMFNILVSGLLTKSSIVLYDGNPAYPKPSKLWEIAAKTKTTMFGSSPAFVQMMKKINLSPKELVDVTSIEGIILSGSPAGPEVFSWMYENVKGDLWLTSQSGGTDIASGFVGAIPIEPVHAGEIQVRALGADVHAFDDAGKELINEVGELVVCKPMPSMPLYFWNDENNERYKESYFDVYPGVWRHGDFIKITERGSSVIYGRSDSTLNRYGVRIGTNEIYSSVEKIAAVKDSIIVNLDLPEGEFYMPLFITLKEGDTLSDELKEVINQTIRVDCSPRHVPDDIILIEQVPYTLTNKKMEVPVRRILMGEAEEDVANRDAMLNPTSLNFFITFRREVVAAMGKK